MKGHFPAFAKENSTSRSLEKTDDRRPIVAGGCKQFDMNFEVRLSSKNHQCNFLEELSMLVVSETGCNRCSEQSELGGNVFIGK